MNEDLPIILFPCSPDNRKVPFYYFQKECQAAQKLGFPVAFVDLDMNFGQEITVTGLIPKSMVIYRGYIVSNKIYKNLEQKVNEFDCKLLNNSKHHLYLSYFPLWYKDQNNYFPNRAFTDTPDSIWFYNSELDNLDLITEKILGHFGPEPVLIKDFIKSRKHEWFEACYIPDASDLEHSKQVIDTFITRQRAEDYGGQNLVGGLVVRKYEQFEKLGTHPKSKLPMVNEIRAFYLYGRLFFKDNYWELTKYPNQQDDFPIGKSINSLVQSRFYAVDFAKLENHDFWTIVEINDGGSAGIPLNPNISEEEQYDLFYSSLKQVYYNPFKVW